MESYIPYDILRLISLYLKPYHLTINKELFSIYNNTWYFDKLRLFNLIDNSYMLTNYRDMYYKYLNTGTIKNIFHPGNLMVQKGFKVSLNHILTYEGNLYLQINDEVILIDNHVIDVDHYSYIKDYKWYMYDGLIFKQLDISPVSKFIKVIHTFGYCFVLTNDGIYYNICNSTINLTAFYVINSITDIHFEHGILYAIDINNNMVTLHVKKNKLIQYITNDDIIFKSGKGLFDKNNNPILQNGRNTYKSINLPIKITKYFVICQYIIVLSDNIAYVYLLDVLDVNLHTLVYTISNVVDIFNSIGGSYVIIR